MKLMLGTVQFGLDYGVSNCQGQTMATEVHEILRLGTAEGIEFLDTAYGYGESESVLGQFKEELSRYQVVTKIPDLDKTDLSLQEIFSTSLQRLKLPSVYGLLFHNPRNLLSARGSHFYQQVVALKEQGKCQKIGVSVYSVEQLKEILSHYKIDFVQLPLNILDQRFYKNNFLRDLKNQGIEIHVRSIFLQGLLLMDLHNIPSYFHKMKGHLEYVRGQIENSGMTPLATCLSFVKSISEIDRIVVGINNVEQLCQLIHIYNQREVLNLEFSQFECHDEDMLMPTNWKLHD